MQTRWVAVVLGLVVGTGWPVRPVAGQTATEKLVEEYRSGKRKVFREVIRDAEGRAVNHGSYMSYFEGGARREQGKFRRGRKHGEWKTWHESGQIAARGKYQKGLRHGSWKSWGEDGTVDPIESGKYTAHVSTDDNGTQTAEGEFLRDRRHGHWTFWWTNGTPKLHGEYREGIAHGTWWFWHPDRVYDERMFSGTFEAGRRTGPAVRPPPELPAVESPLAKADLVSLLALPGIGEKAEFDRQVTDATLGDANRRSDAIAQLSPRKMEAIPIILEQLLAIDLSQDGGEKEGRQLHELLLELCDAKGLEWSAGTEAIAYARNRHTVRRWFSFWLLARDSWMWWQLDLSPADRGHPGHFRADLLADLIVPEMMATAELSESRRRSPSEATKAVELALNWLAAHQSQDGGWRSAEFNNQCKTTLCDGKGSPLFDIGVTSMALLAFLGDGHLREDSPYLPHLIRGVEFLLRSQDRETGRFWTIWTHEGQASVSIQSVYEHAAATTVLAEVFARTGSPRLQLAAQRAVNFCHQSRNPYKAWRYHYPPSGDNDLSVTGWVLRALFTAKAAGLHVDPDALKDGMAFVDEMTDPTTWRAGYRERGSPPSRHAEDLDAWPQDLTESMTALALWLRFLHGQSSEEPSFKGAASLLQRKLPVWDESRGTIDPYYWYFGTLAMWNMSGRYWKDWQSKVNPALTQHQRTDPEFAGSWDPQVDPWGDSGGRVYSTALNAMTLQVPWRKSVLK